MYCCQKMIFFLKEQKIELSYSAKEREYGINLKNVDAIQLIYFCPWCSKELPSSLSEKWFEELEKLGFDEPLSEEQERKIPSEFLTDEWWKKRGL